MRPPITWINPTMIPAIKAPVMLPKPPKTTTTNAVRTNTAPTWGKMDKR